MKTFYVFKVQDERGTTPFSLQEIVEGSVEDARGVIESEAYADGTYICLEDTSGFITKTTERKSKIEFTLPEGRKRKKE